MRSLNEYRHNAKKVDPEEIEDSLGKDVIGFMKSQLGDQADGLQEVDSSTCQIISKHVENISKAVLKRKVSMYIVQWMVHKLLWHCDNLVHAVDNPSYHRYHRYENIINEESGYGAI